MRTWRRLSIAGLLICLLGLYPLLAPPAHRIDKAHFELIQKGMTLAEVESIFGQPAGEYDWAMVDGVWGVAFSPDGRRLWATTKARYYTTVFLHSGNTDKTWTSRHGTCTIWFDENLRVSGGLTSWGSTRVEPPWLKWWKKWFGE